VCLRYKRPEHNLVASAEIGATNGTLKALPQKSGFRLGTGQYRNAVASGQTRPYNRAPLPGGPGFSQRVPAIATLRSPHPQWHAALHREQD
jgi:hypothetical protein